jgi:condensin complex subunit 2
MSDIVLNKEIVGGVTNFQVVGCTIDVGTKIYAARVDALHQNTYQMLSGLGHNANPDEENGDSNVTTNRLDGDDDNFDNDNENDEHAGNKKAKAKKKRMKKSSQIAENLDSITSKLRDEFQDEDLYFSKISTCIENEAVAGTLLNKLHFIDDSFKIYINAEDKLCSTSLTPSSFKLSAGVEINCKDIIDIYRAKQQDLRNLKLCSELSSFRFIGWNLDSNVNFLF